MAHILLVNSSAPFPTEVLAAWQSNHPPHVLTIVQQSHIDLASVLGDHPQTEILLVNYGDYSRHALARLSKLQTVIATTTATEYIDEHCCSERGIRVYNTQDYTKTAVAEHLLALMLTVARKLPLMPTKTGTDLLALELYGKKLGILGFGSIAQRFAPMAKGLGMEVAYFNRTKKPSTVGQQKSLDEILAQSDVLACTLPLTQETHHLIGQKELAQLPKGAIVVSISPDEVFDIPALAHALQDEHLFGVGLDLHNDHEHLFSGNFIGTHTKAWFTKECLYRRTETFLSVLNQVVNLSSQ